ncbi:MAG: hypothetical protein RLY20_572, partial [Verrucomicrobiota bacterium]
MIKLLRRISLSQWILIAMVSGILLGWLIYDGTASFEKSGLWQLLSNFTGGFISAKSPETLQLLCKLGSGAFLHLIKCIIVPLLFSTLVVGIAGHTDDMKAVGRLAFKSILYFEAVTTMALVVGLGAVNLIRPGDGIHLTASAEKGKEFAQTKVTLEGLVEHLTPQSFFDAAA